jgi:hypothetical protein
MFTHLPKAILDLDRKERLFFPDVRGFRAERRR